MNLFRLTIIIAFLFLSGCDMNKNHCKNFMYGEFVYFNREEKSYNNEIVAIREKDLQIYINKEKGDTLKYSISWISNCEYELELLETNVDIKPGMVQVGEKMVVKIEPIDESSFNYTSILEKEGLSREFQGLMKKIK